MEERKTNGENQVDKVPVLNQIFEGLITDASDLIRDLYWGVKTFYTPRAFFRYRSTNRSSINSLNK